MPTSSPRCVPVRLLVLLSGCATAQAPDASPPDARPAVYTVGGTVTDLAGTLVLQNNGADDLTLKKSGPFVFVTKAATHDPYDVTVRTEPPEQRCGVTNGQGAVATANVTDVAVTCKTLRVVGGTVTGLSGTLVLRNNGGDDLTLTGDGRFGFATGLVDGDLYAVTVATFPAGQLCIIALGAGTVAGADVTDVAVTCQEGHLVGGSVTGLLGGTLTLQNGTDTVSRTSDGSFTFRTPVATGTSYAVTVKTAPLGQMCDVAGGTGPMGSVDISSVAVTCHAQVVLNEVLARPGSGAYGDTNGDGVRDSSQDEFVEILNVGTTPVDLSGWVVKSGAATPATRHTFAAQTTLAAGARAVVFGGGTPTGGFGGALVFTAASGLSLTDAPSTTFTVTLESAASGGFVLDRIMYGPTSSPPLSFDNTCTTDCASLVRAPEGTGGFVSHAQVAVSGSTGILWSPGVAAAAAVPKVATAFGTPKPPAPSVSVVTPIVVQFNMFMTPADFSAANLKLYASDCATSSPEVTDWRSFGAGVDLAQAKLVPNVALGYATAHCVKVSGAGLHSANAVALGGDVSWEFTTRTATSVAATNVVISEYGGCRMSSSNGGPCTGGLCSGGPCAHDTFVELYNPTGAAVDISGWSIQRRSAGGSSSCWAILPATTSIAAGGFYLVGGAGYDASHYGGVAYDFKAAPGTGILGSPESIVLLSTAGTCTGTTGIVDSVSVGAVTETGAFLALPPLDATLTDGTSVERKACYDSTTATMAASTSGNGEKFGASNADWVPRTTPQPQRSTSTLEPRTCP